MHMQAHNIDKHPFLNGGQWYLADPLLLAKRPHFFPSIFLLSVQWPSVSNNFYPWIVALLRKHLGLSSLSFSGLLPLDLDLTLERCMLAGGQNLNAPGQVCFWATCFHRIRIARDRDRVGGYLLRPHPISLQLWGDSKVTHIFIVLVQWSLVACHLLLPFSCCRFHSVTLVSLMMPMPIIIVSSGETRSGVWLEQQKLLLSDYFRLILKDTFALGLISLLWFS